MKKFRRKFSKEFKLTALRRLEAGESVNEVARALSMDASAVRRWRREWSTQGAPAKSAASPATRPRWNKRWAGRPGRSIF